MAESALRQYEYGRGGLLGIFAPVRREIISPAQSLPMGYTSTRRGIGVERDNIPAQYGEPEISPTYAPAYRGLRSALHALYDFGQDPMGTIRGIIQSAPEVAESVDQYMRDQYTAGALGGTAYNPETGRVTEFDPTIAMVGGAPAGVQAVRAATPGSVVLGMVGSKNAKFTPEQLAAIRQIDEAGFDTDRLFLHGTSDEIDQLSIGKTQKRDSGYIGTGAYSTPEPRISGGYANLATPTTRDNMGDWAGPNTFPLITKKGNYKQYTLKEKTELAQKARSNPEFSQQLADQNISEGYIGADVVDADGNIVERVNYFPDTDTRSAFDYSIPETTLRSGSKQGTGVAGLSALNRLDIGEDEYIDLINPRGRRIEESARPNLMMGDMYGMLPRDRNYLREIDVEGFGPVKIYESNGDIYATGYNPDVGEQDVIGYMIGGGDSTELAVVGELQGKGLGGQISYEFRSRNPMALSGGLTEAGERTARSAYRRMQQEKNN